MAQIKLRVKNTPIRLKIKPNKIHLKMAPAKLVTIGGETYVGAYKVIPSVVEQTLKTAGKVASHDIEVTAIPYAEVCNSFGGVTITIGG